MKTAPPFRLLWVTPRWPLPAQDGARQATFHLVQSLARLNVEIRLAAIVARGEVPNPALAESEAMELLGVREARVFERAPTRHFLTLLTKPWLPLTIAPLMSRRIAREILDWHRGWDPAAVVVFDGLHSAGWYALLPKAIRNQLRVAHRSHNVESNLWHLGARRYGFPKSWVLKYQAWLMERFERKICRESRLVAAVSENDVLGLRQLCGGTIRQTVTPIGVLPKVSPSDSPSRKNLLFVGRMDWAPNRDGLRWFLEEVWPEAIARSPDLSLTIAGAGDGSWLQPFLSLPGLKFLGRVDDLAPLYRDCVACLVPIFFGSGTRVKAIEAGSYARACISTQIGVEGIGLEEGVSYFRAETREDWLHVLAALSVEESMRLGQSAHALISERFDPMRVASRFLSELERSL